MDIDGNNGNKRDAGGVSDHLYVMADLVSAYVSNNSLRASDLPDLIAAVDTALRQLSTPPTAVEPTEAPKPPAVPVKKSITDDFIICLEDGKKFRSLKRHLGTVYNMTPEKYREKWGLPADYPMVAPAYSAVRSKLAKAIGLGQPTRDAAKPAAANTAEPARKTAAARKPRAAKRAAAA